jgi:hypothetical protein
MENEDMNDNVKKRWDRELKNMTREERIRCLLRTALSFSNGMDGDNKREKIVQEKIEKISALLLDKQTTPLDNSFKFNGTIMF